MLDGMLVETEFKVVFYCLHMLVLDSKKAYEKSLCSDLESESGEGVEIRWNLQMLEQS